MPGSNFRITIKVFMGFLLLVAAMCIALFIIKSSLREYSGLVNKIEDPNAFIQTWSNSLNSLEQSGNAMNRYSASADSSDLADFEMHRNVLNAGIDTLYKLSKNRAGRNLYVDTLTQLVDRRMLLYTTRAFTAIENKNMGSFDNAIKKFAIKEIKINKNANDLVKTSATDVKPNKNNFWQRLFSKKNKKKKDDEPAPPDTATSKIVDQNIKKSDLPLVIAELRKTEKLAKEENIKNMLNLIADEQSIDHQIYSLTRHMEGAEIKATRSQIKQTSNGLETSTNNIMLILGACAIVFMLLFTLLIQRDVTRDTKVQKELETARKNAVELAKARQDFASSMSHEIRTPLNALVGFSEQLAKSNLNAEQTKMVNALLRSSNHLMGVINPVLDYSKITAGKALIEKFIFDINDVLNDTCLLFEQQANDKNIELYIDSLPKGYNMVQGDVVKLKQIIFNLVSNAIKFTPKGNITVSCKVLNDVGDTRTYEFSVQDTGMGIAPEKLKIIFDEFTQADNSITRQYGGTGLGLNIVKSLVELQGGSISVTSTVGQGSRFVFDISYIAATTVVVEDKSEDIPQNTLEGKTILVCDDEEMNRMLIEHILTRYGAKVIEAPGSLQMLDEIEKKHVDLLLIDLHMPGMSGIEAIKVIRSNSNSKIANIPVIVVTGDVREGEKERILADGMNGYIAKPFVEAQLLEVILSIV